MPHFQVLVGGQWDRNAGAYGLAVISAKQPDRLVAARSGSPLVIGLGDGENFVGSDVTAFIAHTRTARAVEQDQVVEVRRTGVVVTDLDGAVVEGDSYHVDWDTDAAEKGGYEFFMLKEIEEQPAAVRETLGGRLTPEGLLHLDELAMSDEDVRGIDQVFIVACGSAYHSGLVGKYAIERWTRLPVQVEVGPAVAADTTAPAHVPAEGFSVRWPGQIAAPAAGAKLDVRAAAMPDTRQAGAGRPGVRAGGHGVSVPLRTGAAQPGRGRAASLVRDPGQPAKTWSR